MSEPTVVAYAVTWGQYICSWRWSAVVSWVATYCARRSTAVRRRRHCCEGPASRSVLGRVDGHVTRASHTWTARLENMLAYCVYGVTIFTRRIPEELCMKVCQHDASSRTAPISVSGPADFTLHASSYTNNIMPSRYPLATMPISISPQADAYHSYERAPRPQHRATRHLGGLRITALPNTIRVFSRQNSIAMAGKTSRLRNRCLACEERVQMALSPPQERTTRPV